MAHGGPNIVDTHTTERRLPGGLPVGTHVTWALDSGDSFPGTLVHTGPPNRTAGTHPSGTLVHTGPLNRKTGTHSRDFGILWVLT